MVSNKKQCRDYDQCTDASISNNKHDDIKITLYTTIKLHLGETDNGV